MAEDQSHDDDELNIDADEKGSSDASTTDKDEDVDSDQQKNDDSSKDGEENKESLNLEEEKTASTVAAQKRQEQENAWFGKIVSGQKTLDDLPKHQQWLKPELEKRLNAHNKAQEVVKEYDIDAIVEQKLNEKEDRQTFKTMETVLSEMSLTSQQVASLKAEFKDFRQAGLSLSKSLEKAIKVVGINVDTDIRRKYMAPPKAGNREQRESSSDPRIKYQKGDPRRVKVLNELAEAA